MYWLLSKDCLFQSFFPLENSSCVMDAKLRPKLFRIFYFHFFSIFLRSNHLWFWQILIDARLLGNEFPEKNIFKNSIYNKASFLPFFYLKQRSLFWEKKVPVSGVAVSTTTLALFLYVISYLYHVFSFVLFCKAFFKKNLGTEFWQPYQQNSIKIHPGMAWRNHERNRRYSFYLTCFPTFTIFSLFVSATVSCYIPNSIEKVEIDWSDYSLYTYTKHSKTFDHCWRHPFFLMTKYDSGQHQTFSYS